MAKIKSSDQIRIQSADEISYDAALRLVTDLLVGTYQDYKMALVEIMRLDKKRLPNKKFKSKYDEKKFENARYTKVECEYFYRSNSFPNLVLGKGLRGETVIREIKREVGYNEEIDLDIY